MDKPDGFEMFLREYCEKQGWPFQPEMCTKDVCTYWREIDPSPFEGARMSLEGAQIDAQQYWAEVEGTDEHEWAQLERDDDAN